MTAVCHQGALQLHGPAMEQERNAYGESVVRVCDKERKCDRERDMGKVVAVGGQKCRESDINKDA